MKKYYRNRHSTFLKAIAEQKKKQAEENELIKEKKTDLIRPVAAFITFDTQEGKNRALWTFISEKEEKALEQDESDEAKVRLDHARFYLLGERVVCKQAPEPSEIIWKNRHVTTHQQNIRKVIVFICNVIFLFLMFWLFSYMKSKAIKNMWRYPSTVNCATIDSLFTDANGNVDMAKYQQYASLDEDLTLQRQGSGMYMCFCKAYKSEVGYTNKGDLCYNRVMQYTTGYAISESVTVVITVVNTIITMLCKYAIAKIGYHTITGEITAVTMTIFIATFFNTAILLLLADADLSQITLLSWIPLNGVFPDLTEQWYIIIAPSLILTMVINAFYPYIDLGISFGTLAIYRIMD